MALSRLLRSGLASVVLGVFASASAITGATGCSAETSDDGDAAADENDLTSVTARARTLEFAGTVYVEPNASNDQILQTVRSQTQTAFGPLRTTDMAVNSRELKEVDPSTFVKRNVKVVDVAANNATRDMVAVTYTYKDNAVVGLSLATRSSVPLALLNPSYRSQTDRLIRECTRNDDEAREFASSAWYVFEPSVPQCADAMNAEQTKVDQDRARLTDRANQVTKSEVDRLYIPITVKLGADKTNRGASYPDYQRLYKGGVKQDKLVVSLVYGMIDHGAANSSGDFNWGELMTNLGEFMDAQGDLQIVQGPDRVDLSTFRLASGKTISNPKFIDLVKLHSGDSHLQLSSDEKQELEKMFAERIYQKWIAVEKPIKVAVDNEQPRNFAIQFLVYWGSSSDSRPHKFATKNSDVFLYNGHSSIGYGPLDPRNFTAADFAQTYQILWIDGCVSYNYYHKDYIPLKTRGTKDLDLVTNGIEAPSWRSGHAMGQFLVTLLNGRGASYKDLLIAAKDTDPLRVVDGELDNEFRPDRMRISITNR